MMDHKGKCWEKSKWKAQHITLLMLTIHSCQGLDWKAILDKPYSSLLLQLNTTELSLHQTDWTSCLQTPHMHGTGHCILHYSGEKSLPTGKGWTSMLPSPLRPHTKLQLTGLACISNSWSKAEGCKWQALVLRGKSRIFVNTFQAHSATSKAQEVRKWLDPAASLHGHPLPTARAAELLQLAQGPALAPPGQGKSNTWTSLVPSRPAAAAGRHRAGLSLTQACAELSAWSTHMDRMFNQEQSSQPELSPSTRPRWQNTQLRGESIKDTASCLNLKTLRWHKESFLNHQYIISLLPWIILHKDFRLSITLLFAFKIIPK